METIHRKSLGQPREVPSLEVLDGSLNQWEEHRRDPPDPSQPAPNPCHPGNLLRGQSRHPLGITEIFLCKRYQLQRVDAQTDQGPEIVQSVCERRLAVTSFDLRKEETDKVGILFSVPRHRMVPYRDQNVRQLPRLILLDSLFNFRHNFFQQPLCLFQIIQHHIVRSENGHIVQSRELVLIHDQLYLFSHCLPKSFVLSLHLDHGHQDENEVPRFPILHVAGGNLGEDPLENLLPHWQLGISGNEHLLLVRIHIGRLGPDLSL
mmetsp:Transcript_54853/g.107313  ORF Transcript_54853/g.107313 Transcript_54853/m.107313 type:complete len:263 (-) Transcript_54853:388-1176(-)